jgi:hypothetical protein
MDNDLSQCSTPLETVIHRIEGRMHRGPPIASSEPSKPESSPSEKAPLLSPRRRRASLVAASPRQQVASKHPVLAKCLPKRQKPPQEHNMKRKGPSERAPLGSPKQKGSKIGCPKQKGLAIPILA